MGLTPLKAAAGMTGHCMAMNQRKSPNRGKAFTASLDDYDRLTRQPWLAELLADIRSGKEGLKAQLPFRCAHYSAFKGDRRKQVDILPEAFLFQTTVDVDDAALVADAIQRAQELDRQPGKWQDKLLHIEYSARRKLHIDLRLPVGMTIEETQREYSEAIGVPYDASCITPERFIYITPASEEVYRSAHWYEQLSAEDLQRYRDAFSARGLAADGRKQQKQSSRSTRSTRSTRSPQPSQQEQSTQSAQSARSA